MEVEESLNLLVNNQRTLYAVITEALNNSLKYSSATAVKVSIKIQDTDVCAEVRDNGCGFDVQNSSRRGMGLNNMKERVEALQGALEINSELRQGTCVQIKIPRTFFIEC